MALREPLKGMEDWVLMHATEAQLRDGIVEAKEKAAIARNELEKMERYIVILEDELAWRARHDA